MTKLEQHRKTWQGKSDEWLFERLANELTPDNFEELVKCNCSGRSNRFVPDEDFIVDSLLKYDRSVGYGLRDIAVKEFAVDVVCKKMLDLY